MQTLAPSQAQARASRPLSTLDRKSTRLNSSHLVISYAVFCLKKKTIRQPPFTLSRLTPPPPAHVHDPLIRGNTSGNPPLHQRLNPSTRYRRAPTTELAHSHRT